MFAAIQQKIINSVFLTFKESLLASNHCDKLLRDLGSIFWLFKPLVIYQIAGYLYCLQNGMP